MKFPSVAFAACILEAAMGFNPSPIPHGSSSQLNVVDPESLSHLAQQGVDVARVLMLDCDNQDCSMVEGVKDAGGWHFENKLGGAYESQDPGHTSRILMMEMDDTE